jgi:uncharacterized protein (DUF58 family)
MSGKEIRWGGHHMDVSRRHSSIPTFQHSAFSLTSAGWLVLVLAMVLMAAGWWWGRVEALAAGAALLAMFPLSWWGGRSAVRQVQVRWLVLDLLRCGDEVMLGAELVSRRPSPPLAVWAWSPVARRFAMTTRVVGVNGRAARLRWSARFPRRGLVELPPLQIEASAPFGVVAVRRAGAAGATVVVRPVTGLVRRPLQARLRDWLAEREPRLTAGEDAFDRLRGYRAGDPPHRIHWPASARHRRLVVTQRLDAGTRRVAVVVDGNARRDHARFEVLVAMAATIVEHLQADGWDCSVHGAWLDRAGVTGDPLRVQEALALARIGQVPVLDLIPAGCPALVLAVRPPVGLPPEALVLTVEGDSDLVRLPRRFHEEER